MSSSIKAGWSPRTSVASPGQGSSPTSADSPLPDYPLGPAPNTEECPETMAKWKDYETLTVRSG